MCSVLNMKHNTTRPVAVNAGPRTPRRSQADNGVCETPVTQPINGIETINVTTFEEGRRQGIADRLHRMTEPLGECLIWTGPAYPSGYGRFRFVEMGRKRQTSPHRAAYILKHGSVSAELVIDHLCRNRLCVNTEHLEAVDHAENVARGMWPIANRSRLGRPAVGRVSCPRGHLMTEENTYLHHRARFAPGRECRTCNRELRPPKPEHVQAQREARKKANDASRVQAVSHRRRWSDAEMSLVLQPHLSDFEAAKAMGRTISAIRNKRKRLAQ